MKNSLEGIVTIILNKMYALTILTVSPMQILIFKYHYKKD